MPKLLNEEILSVKQIAPNIFKMLIKSQYIAENALPGQFVNIKCGEHIDALLRRPVSICNVDRDQFMVTIVFQLKGIGTEILSKKSSGSLINVIAPLGTPFDTSKKYEKIMVVGGGIGVFPLLFLLKEVSCDVKVSLLGFKTKDEIVLEDEFRSASHKLILSTDDGSHGYKGTVADLLEKEVNNGYLPDIIYACGPTPMIRKVVEYAIKVGIKCQVSLEQRMACGIGACLVCACKTKHDREYGYSHVCTDGPVFWGEEIIFD